VSDYCSHATGVSGADNENRSAADAFIGCMERVVHSCGMAAALVARDGTEDSKTILSGCLLVNGLSPQRLHWNRPTEVIIKRK
jgi:hypothetical protein